MYNTSSNIEAIIEAMEWADRQPGNIKAWLDSEGNVQSAMAVDYGTTVWRMRDCLADIEDNRSDDNLSDDDTQELVREYAERLLGELVAIS